MRDPGPGLHQRQRRARSGLALSLLLGLQVVSHPAVACKCKRADAFLQVAPQSPLVVVGKVLAHGEQAMDVAVQQVLHGSAPAQIRIAGDNGKLCRPYIATFPVGSVWVFAVSPDDAEPMPRSDGQASPSYALSICGYFWLRVDGSQVRGVIREVPDGKPATEQRLPLSTLRRELAQRTTPVSVAHAAQLKSLLHHRVLLTGTARDAKAGPVLQVDGVPVYIEALEAWSDAQQGQRLRMSGILLRRKRIPDPETAAGALAQGAWGEQYVLVDAQPVP